MKAREIFLVLLIIGAGIFIYYAETGKLDIQWIQWGGEDFFLFGKYEEFVFEESQDIAGPLPRELQVINAHGSVEIQGSPTDKITIAFKKTIFRKNAEEARQVANRLKMIVDRKKPGMILSTNRDDFKRKNFETHFKISVPSGTEVLIKNSYGLVKAAKTGKTDIANPHGEVQAADIGGKLTVNNSYEDVNILGVLADCDITSRHSKITAAGIREDLRLDQSYGEVELQDIGKKVIVKGSHSQVTAKNLRGAVEIESSYEKIALTDAGPATIRGHHCDIEARGISGPLEITNNYAPVRLDGIKGNLSVKGTNMEIQAESVLADEIFISTSYQNVELHGFTGKTTVRLSHGDLTLEPEAVTGPIEVYGSYAGVRFLWPAGGRFPFDALTKYGDIHWNLAEKPSLEEHNGQSVTKAFLDAIGKPLIKISTSHGDISVEERTRAPKTI
ncbi:MAG: DUF4097 family beta strand repeat-containing protein [Candidatus Aminicenantales bacterium]